MFRLLPSPTGGVVTCDPEGEVKSGFVLLLLMLKVDTPAFGISFGLAQTINRSANGIAQDNVKAQCGSCYSPVYPSWIYPTQRYNMILREYDPGGRYVSTMLEKRPYFPLLHFKEARQDANG